MDRVVRTTRAHTHVRKYPSIPYRTLRGRAILELDAVCHHRRIGSKNLPAKIQWLGLAINFLLRRMLDKTRINRVVLSDSLPLELIHGRKMAQTQPPNQKRKGRPLGDLTMKWVEQIPERLGTIPNPSLLGPHASGKTECLIQTVGAINAPTLVITSWPWEKPRWRKSLSKITKQRDPDRKIIIHTPDSLARGIIETWEALSGKKLDWLAKGSVVGIDPITQAQNLLNQRTLTPDAAHWLLKDNIDEMLVWKKPIGLLALDNPEEWDPDARAWIDTLPYKRKLQTGFGEGSIWLPQKSPTPQEARWLKSETTSEGVGQWVIRKHRENPKRSKILVIQSDKEKWEEYLTARGIDLPIRHAAECQGRFWDEAIVPNLTQGWGSPTTALQWLDLVASRCKQICLVRIHPDDPPKWLPKKPIGKDYLIWKPEI